MQAGPRLVNNVFFVVVNFVFFIFSIILSLVSSTSTSAMSENNIINKQYILMLSIQLLSNSDLWISFIANDV